MAKEYLFSVCLYIESDTNLERSISGIIGKEKFFCENMQLLLLDKLCSEYTIGLCEKYTAAYPENIFFVECRGNSREKAYNNARPLALGHYIAFTDNLGVYTSDTFGFIAKNIDPSVLVLTLNPLTFSPSDGEEYYMPKYDEGWVHIDNTPDRFHFMLGAYFFNRHLIDGLYFDDTLQFHADACFIIEALRLAQSYYFLRSFNYTTARLYEYDFNAYPPQYNKAFYSASVQKLLIPYLQEHGNSAFVQSAMLYLLLVKFSLNMDDRFKCMLASSEVTEFFQICSEAMAYIADPIILNPELYRRIRLVTETAFRLLRLKYHNKYLKPEIHYVAEGNCTYTGRDLKQKTVSLHKEWVATVGDALVGRSSDIAVKITAMNYDRHGLILDGVLEGAACFDGEGTELFIVREKREYKVQRTGVYSLTKFFGVSLLSLYTFHLYIPLGGDKKVDDFKFYIRIKGKVCNVSLTFGGEGARLSTEMKNSYWVFANKMVYTDPKSNTIIVRRATDSLIRHSESKYLSELFHHVTLREYLYYRKLRSLFRKALKAENRETIWTFYDESGIDRNGNLLFRFIRKFRANSGITPYFSVKAGSSEEAFLMPKYGNTAQIGTERQKLIVMLSDIIVATDCEVYEALGFTAKDRLYLRDLFQAHIVSVKNFFMTARTAQFDNRLRDNVSLMFCCSENERKQLLHPVYGYAENMLRVTGYPMFDAFRAAPERQVLIYPAEHHEFMMYENLSDRSFTDTAFFKVYNTLLNDKKLLEFAERQGYKIILLLPPSLEKFVRYFTTTGVTEVVPYTPEAEHSLISKSSVLLTDFAEAHYIFAYLNRAIVYYLPPAISIPEEFHNMNLTEKGFGAVTFVQKDTVRQLCDCMRHEVPNLQGVYKFRRDTFFTYMDYQNCERVFEQLKEYQRYIRVLKNHAIGPVEKKNPPAAAVSTENKTEDASQKEPELQTVETENISMEKPAVPVSGRPAETEPHQTPKEPKERKVIQLEEIDPTTLQTPVRPQK